MGVFDMQDMQHGNKRLIIFTEKDKALTPKMFREYVSSVLAEDWELIEVSQGREFILKFTKK
jgi:hypothetical protein